MKKVLFIALAAILIISTLVLSSCSIIEDLRGAVKYPESYSVTYEISSEDGVIRTMTKTVDEDGNVYFLNNGEEKLYIKNGTSYTLYERRDENGQLDKNGSFTPADEKYTKAAVDVATSDFAVYAEKSKDKYIPTAKLDGEGKVAGRVCEIYKIGVGTENNNSYHYYYVDKETGICLKLEVRNTALGTELEYTGESFVCTEFITEGVSSLTDMI